MIKSLSALTLVLALAGCTSTPLELDNSQKNKDGLSLVKNSKMNMAYVKAGVDWRRFSKVYFQPVIVTNDHTDDYKAPNIDRRAEGLDATYELDEAALQDLADAFNKVILDVFDDEQPYELVASADENTLVVQAIVTDIRLSAPVEDSRRSFSAGGATYTQNSGSMMLLAQVNDGKDNSIIAKAADRGQLMDQWQQNTKVFNMGDAKTIYRNWANDFKNALISTHAEQVNK